MSLTELYSVHFWHFCVNFGCFGNSLCSIKIFISIFELADPENHTIRTTLSPYFVHNLNLCNFGLFLPNLGCHGNSRGSVENSGSIFEFTKPVKPCVKQYMRKILQFLARNGDLCNFSLFFV